MRLEMLVISIIFFLTTSFSLENDNFKIEYKIEKIIPEEKYVEIHLNIYNGNFPFEIFVYESSKAPWKNKGEPVIHLQNQFSRDLIITLNNISEGIYYIMVKDSDENIKVKKIEIRY